MRIAKAWKRGYPLHGPPKTAKSSLVAAMANHPPYHVYDLNLSLVDSNMSCSGCSSSFDSVMNVEHYNISHSEKL
jgi:hypothetical protein